MSKCINNCHDPAEHNFTWPTSNGPMSANLCGACASQFWSKFNHTPCGQGLIIMPVKSRKELAEICSEYQESA